MTTGPDAAARRWRIRVTAMPSGRLSKCSTRPRRSLSKACAVLPTKDQGLAWPCTNKSSPADRTRVVRNTASPPKAGVADGVVVVDDAWTELALSVEGFCRGRRRKPSPSKEAV